MAPPSQSHMRPSRYLFALATIFIVLFAIVLGTGSGSFRDRLAPKLAIDLAGGTQMVLQARTPTGDAPDSSRLEQARLIIEERVNAYGVAEAEVYTQGNDKIIVAVPGASDDSIREIGQTAEMRFRKVLATIPDTAGVTPAPTPSPSADPSASPGASPAVTGSADPSASPTASPSPTATASPTPSASPTATPTAAAAPTPSATNAALPALADVQDKLGDAYAVADGIDLAQVAQGSLSVSSDASLMAQLEPFGQLTPAEVAVLPYNIQYVVPQIGCATLNKRPVGSIVDPTQRAVACENPGATKYLLDVADVEGRDLGDAVANIGTTPGGGLGAWQVDLNFTTSGREGRPSGSDLWNALTREAFENTGDAWASGPGTTGVPNNPNCIATVPTTGDSSRNACMVAAVLDNEIVTAPVIQQVLSTQSTITGDFTKETAQTLATQLKYGALPVSFETASLNTVTATLGSDYLQAGLLAAGIGLALVVIYAFFYYRLLGSVIMLSLVLSALLTFGMLVALGRGIGFTLSLAGIAGFIVSLGVAADSFVIYFERLKDEIREGRTPRAAVNRAWARARRTIVTANAVTIMAAVVLYLVGSSAVQGFAFALGLATLLDLIIVFLFRHPMMTMLARTPAFLSPRVSGLGRVLGRGKSEDGGTAGRTRTKEA